MRWEFHPAINEALSDKLEGSVPRAALCDPDDHLLRVGKGVGRRNQEHEFRETTCGPPGSGRRNKNSDPATPCDNRFLAADGSDP
jgi:hypothetical protein